MSAEKQGTHRYDWQPVRLPSIWVPLLCPGYSGTWDARSVKLPVILPGLRILKCSSQRAPQGLNTCPMAETKPLKNISSLLHLKCSKVTSACPLTLLLDIVFNFAHDWRNGRDTSCSGFLTNVEYDVTSEQDERLENLQWGELDRAVNR